MTRPLTRVRAGLQREVFKKTGYSETLSDVAD